MKKQREKSDKYKSFKLDLKVVKDKNWLATDKPWDSTLKFEGLSVGEVLRSDPAGAENTQI